MVSNYERKFEERNTSQNGGVQLSGRVKDGQVEPKEVEEENEG